MRVLQPAGEEIPALNTRSYLECYFFLKNPLLQYPYHNDVGLCTVYKLQVI
jgi:hypothetical protein